MPRPSASGSTRILLLVEDDVDTVYLFRHAFRKVGLESEWEVRHVLDGHEAMEFILRNGSPQAIVTDLRGIHVSGAELIRWMRGNSLLRHIPIFVFSNSEELADRNACYDAGADEFLSKKATPEELRGMIRRLVGMAETPAVDKVPSTNQAPR